MSVSYILCLPLLVAVSVRPSSQPSILSQLDPQSQILLTFLLGFQTHETTSEDPLTAPSAPVPSVKV